MGSQRDVTITHTRHLSTYHLFIVYPSSIIYIIYQLSTCINYSICPAISSSQIGKYLLDREPRVKQSAACWPKGHRCPGAGPGYEPREVLGSQLSSQNDKNASPAALTPL